MDAKLASKDRSLLRYFLTSLDDDSMMEVSDLLTHEETRPKEIRWGESGSRFDEFVHYGLEFFRIIQISQWLLLGIGESGNPCHTLRQIRYLL